MGRKNRGDSKFWSHKKIFPPGLDTFKPSKSFREDPGSLVTERGARIWTLFKDKRRLVHFLGEGKPGPYCGEGEPGPYCGEGEPGPYCGEGEPGPSSSFYTL